MRGLKTVIFGLILCIVQVRSSIPRWGLKSQQIIPTQRQKKLPYDFHSNRAGEYLLPTYLKPLEYDISIIPYLDTPAERAFTFDGHVTILFEVISSTTIVRLHSYNLTIGNITVQGLQEKDPREISSVVISTDDKQFLSIYLTLALEENALYWLDIDFSGTLKDDLFGFYRSSYLDQATGNTKWMGVTFFEAAGARRAFPCWDEPIWRANFTMHIAHSETQGVLSNMDTAGDDTPLENIPGLEQWMWTHFQTSVSMTTYLVAFSVSEFLSVTEPTDNSQSAWARPGAEHQGVYGISVAPPIVTYMEQYTNQVYPLPKMDHIALPDFVAGAMENWGLITYRETALLFEEGVSSTANKQRVATVVTHEISHYWFGNLVSPKWWDYIWLNEGFATYFEYHAMGVLEPSWELVHQFVIEEMYTSLQTDSFETTHPVVDTVENPNGNEPVFDGLAYTKGGPLVRFICNLMGEQNFIYGIQNYMNDSAYGNANIDDLWNSLQPYVPPDLLPDGSDMTTVMRPWLTQSGYPVINVTRDYNDSTRMASITQERFVVYPSGSLPLDELWSIPLTYTSEYDIDFTDLSVKGWLEDTEVSLELPITADQWILFNVQQIGFYRVNYDARNWRMLINALQIPLLSAQIHPINRAQLMDDSLALARAKHLDYTTALDTTAYLKEEKKYAPWASALGAFSFLYDRLNYEQYTRELLEWYILEQMTGVYLQVGGVFEGTDNETHVDKMLRILVLRWACEFGHQECRNETTYLFQTWQQETYPDRVNPIAPDLRSVTYCMGMREGGPDDYTFLDERYGNATKVASEQEILLKALACASDSILLEKVLFKSITPGSGVRFQDAKNVFTWVYSNRFGVDVALDFLIAYYPEASLAYGGMGTVGGLFAGLATKLNTQEQRDKLERFKNDNEAELGDALSGLNAALVTVDQNMAWQQDHKEEVVAYLEAIRGPIPEPGAATSTSASFVMLLIAFASSLFVG